MDELLIWVEATVIDGADNLVEAFVTFRHVK